MTSYFHIGMKVATLIIMISIMICKATGSLIKHYKSILTEDEINTRRLDTNSTHHVQYWRKAHMQLESSKPIHGPFTRRDIDRNAPNTSPLNQHLTDRCGQQDIYDATKKGKGQDDSTQTKRRKEYKKQIFKTNYRIIKHRSIEENVSVKLMAKAINQRLSEVEMNHNNSFFFLSKSPKS